MTQQTEPAYVNLQSTPVMVPDEKHRNRTVLPWANRLKPGHTMDEFVVFGPHYRQFVSQAGPLYPFPGTPQELAASRAGGVAGLAAAAAPAPAVAAAGGRYRGTGEVLRKGQVVGDTPPIARDAILGALKRLGISSFQDFHQASKETLLQIPGVTAAMLPRLRERALELFPESEHPQQDRVLAGPHPLVGKPVSFPDDAGDPSYGRVETVDANDVASVRRFEVAEGQPDPFDLPVADLSELTQYPRAELTEATQVRLREIIEAENLDIPSKMKVDEMRDQVIASLSAYGQVIEG